MTISGARFTDEGVAQEIAGVVRDVYPEMSADSIVERAFCELEDYCKYKDSAIEIEKVEMDLTHNQSVAVVRY